MDQACKASSQLWFSNFAGSGQAAVTRRLPALAAHWLPRVAAASVLAGIALLGAGLAADLLLHDATHQALLAELPPRAAALVAEQAARETANPWHRVLVIGEALLVLGLGGLYLSERGRGVRAERNG